MAVGAYPLFIQAVLSRVIGKYVTEILIHVRRTEWVEMLKGNGRIEANMYI